jgi:transcriptional regulator with XRE-family HTH domain
VKFGAYVRGLREAKGLSVRQAARQIGVDHTYLSKLEREERLASDASEGFLEALAGVLEVNPHLLLAMAGKVTREFQEALQKRPEAFAALLQSSMSAPTPNILQAARTVRDGDW